MDSINVLFVDDLSIKAVHDRMSGVLRYTAQKQNWQIHLINPFPQYLPVLERLAENHTQIDGFLGYPEYLFTTGLYTRRQIARIPIVSIEPPKNTRIHYKPDVLISFENETFGKTAAYLLLNRGMRTLAYVGCDRLIDHPEHDTSYSRCREAAFHAAVLAAGAEYRCYQPDSNKDWNNELTRLSDWIAQLPFPCGIFAFNDKCAQKVVNACHLAHVTIPDQIQLIGVDNEIEICENLCPPLTSIQPDFENCGYLAAQALDDILAHGRPKTTRTISCGIKRIVERASTQDLKGGGRIVAMACEFMRQHAAEQITMEDVARHLNMSSRTIALRFNDILHTSPGKILRNYRLEHSLRLLAESNRSVNDIAASCGFASPSHLLHLFKKTYGQTPGEYRRQR